MSMWCDDESKAGGECQLSGNQARELEKEYLRIRILLQETEVELRKNPLDPGLKEKVNELRQQQMALESQGRFADEYPLEFALGAPPHG